MSKQQFHGSDLEAISKHYNIPISDIVNFAGNVNPLGTSSKVLNDLREHLDMIATYPDRNYTRLKEVISEYVSCNSNQVLVGNGSTELISLGITHIKAKKALILGPTYSEYERELQLISCSLNQYNLPLDKDLSTSISDITATLSQEYDFLIICNPNNPTGSAWTVKELTILLDYCKKQDIFVMIDETYMEFATTMETYSGVTLCNAYDNLLVLRGFSKFFAAPGIRLGYGITSNQPLIDSIQKHQNPWSVNTLGAYAGELMLMDKEYCDMTRSLILPERDRMIYQMNSHDIFHPYASESNFILVKILSQTLTSFDVFEACIKKGLFIRDCKSFFGDEGEYIRFCIMNPEDNDRLLQIFKELNDCYS